jgi:hypothetical protein
MPKRGAQNDVWSSDNFMPMYGLNSTISIDNTRFNMRSNHPVDGFLLATRFSYNWVVLGCRRVGRGERGACS